MPNFAAVLKNEINRLARKEVKAQTASLKRAAAQHRRDIAGLKRQVGALEKKVAFLESQERKRVVEFDASKPLAKRVRFAPAWLRAHRKRLKLPAVQYARLVGASLKSIYAWEQGQTKPRKAQLAALVTVRGLGRREALARLEMLNNAKPTRTRARGRKPAGNKRRKRR